jgi:hypothetical protein
MEVLEFVRVISTRTDFPPDVPLVKIALKEDPQEGKRRGFVELGHCWDGWGS